MNIVTQFKSLFMACAMVLLTSCTSFAGPLMKPSALPTVELNRYNTYVFSEEINPVTTDVFVAALVGKRIMLDQALGRDAMLYVVLVSGGGLYDNSLIMRNALRKIPNVTLICKYCAYAAGFIFISTGVPKLAIKKTIMLMHEMYLPHVTAKHTLNAGMLASLRRSSDEFNKAHYTVIGISKEEYEKKITDKEWTVRGAELIPLHLADKIVKLNCDQTVKFLAPDTCSE